MVDEPTWPGAVAGSRSSATSVACRRTISAAIRSPAAATCASAWPTSRTRSRAACQATPGTGMPRCSAYRARTASASVAQGGEAAGGAAQLAAHHLGAQPVEPRAAAAQLVGPRSRPSARRRWERRAVRACGPGIGSAAWRSRQLRRGDRGAVRRPPGSARSPSGPGASAPVSMMSCVVAPQWTYAPCASHRSDSSRISGTSGCCESAMPCAQRVDVRTARRSPRRRSARPPPAGSRRRRASARASATSASSQPWISARESSAARTSWRAVQIAEQR